MFSFDPRKPSASALVALLALMASACSSEPASWPRVFGLRDVCIPGSATPETYLVAFGSIELDDGQTLDSVSLVIDGDAPDDLTVSVGVSGVSPGDAMAMTDQVELAQPGEIPVTGPGTWPLVFTVTVADEVHEFAVSNVDLEINGSDHRTDEIFDAVLGPPSC